MQLLLLLMLLYVQWLEENENLKSFWVEKQARVWVSNLTRFPKQLYQKFLKIITSYIIEHQFMTQSCVNEVKIIVFRSLFSPFSCTWCKVVSWKASLGPKKGVELIMKTNVLTSILHTFKGKSKVVWSFSKKSTHINRLDVASLTHLSCLT